MHEGFNVITLAYDARAAILLTRTVASELSARVTASMFASSSLPIFSKKRSVSKCLGVSSSTITVGPF